MNELSLTESLSTLYSRFSFPFLILFFSFYQPIDENTQ